MSYVISHIDLSQLVRQSIDSKNKGQTSIEELDAAYNSYMRRLPAFYQLNATVNSAPPISSIQKFLLHEAVFDQLLKLHRGRLGDGEGRRSCLPLAHALFESQQVSKVSDRNLLVCSLLPTYPVRSHFYFPLTSNREVGRSVQSSSRSGST